MKKVLTVILILAVFYFSYFVGDIVHSMITDWKAVQEEVEE